jgi:hypothetical protein
LRNESAWDTRENFIHDIYGRREGGSLIMGSFIGVGRGKGFHFVARDEEEGKKTVRCTLRIAAGAEYRPEGVVD